MSRELHTTDVTQTQALAARLAPLLRGGEVIELVSDLGGGKTSLTQGLLTALGYLDRVTSPTFTLCNIYLLPSGLEVHHYDLFRLGEVGLVGDELTEGFHDPRQITILEWANTAGSRLPPDRLRILISVTGETSRAISLSAGGRVSERLVEGLTQCF